MFTIFRGIVVSDFWKCKIDPTFYHSTFIPGELSHGIVFSVKKTWQNCFLITLLWMPKQSTPALSAPLSTSLWRWPHLRLCLCACMRTHARVCVCSCGGANQAGKTMDFFIHLCQNQSFLKVKKSVFKISCNIKNTRFAIDQRV